MREARQVVWALTFLVGVVVACDVDVVDVESLDDAALAALKARVEAEWRSRATKRGPSPVLEEDSRPSTNRSRLGFAYPHKQTFATSDPAAAARFARDLLGGHVVITNTSHTCADGSLSGYTHIVNFEPTRDAPKGFSVHFVRNPHKPPGPNGTVPGTDVNAMTLGEKVEAWRAGFIRGFDQFVDTHLGLAYDSLDPLVDLWEREQVPYICRTWCCAPDHPGGCPRGVETDFCEQGCYVEAPHGIIIEALCGLGQGISGAEACLTKATPQVFDLCSTS